MLPKLGQNPIYKEKGKKREENESREMVYGDNNNLESTVAAKVLLV